MPLGRGVRRFPVPHCLSSVPGSVCCRVGAETQTTEVNNKFLVKVTSAVHIPNRICLLVYNTRYVYIIYNLQKLLQHNSIVNFTVDLCIRGAVDG
jgi:hypothetical protein